MDDIDKKILSLLQNNATLPLSELSKRVGISKTPCWNRIRKMEEENIIKNKVAILNNSKVNLPIIIFLSLIILFSFWINAYESPFHTLIDTFKQTMNLTKGPETFIINGYIYNTIDTPSNYLPLFLLLRFPLFIIMLTLLFLITLIIKKDFFLEKYELSTGLKAAKPNLLDEYTPNVFNNYI